MRSETTPVNKFSLLLTEDGLFSMPESDYMNFEQLEFFRIRLEGLEQGILAYAKATSDNLRETEFVSDPTDRATIEERYGLELRTRDREYRLLKKIQQAITRIKSGQYGWCDETGESIGIARLLARPMANLTLDAQERREQKQKLSDQ